MHRSKFAFVFAWVPALFACSGKDPVDLGENHPAKTGESLSDYAAVWDGYAEAYTFNSGSDRVRIQLDGEGHGSIIFGNGTPPPPATDPEAAYPPGTLDSGLIEVDVNQIYEGFAYTVGAAAVANRRIQLGASEHELFDSWCELQTPVLNTDRSTPEAPYYSCMAAWTGAKSTDDGACVVDYKDGEQGVPISCAVLAMCGGYPVCDCTEQSCTAGVVTSLDQAPILLDAALEDGGDGLVGTITLRERVTVRLTRQ